MTRREPWQIEVDEVMKHEEWKLTGLTRPIKVCPAERPLEFDVGGYFTLAKYLLRKIPKQIEKDLGLPDDYLHHGARIYKFTRLPQITEYEYELTANFPDGSIDRGPARGKPYYPPGNPKIHQWRILKGKSIPVDPEYFTIRPGFTVPESWLMK
ncbi:MAG: hypothetical protein ACLGXA_20060 [Acidobacteriota bacterium]